MSVETLKQIAIDALDEIKAKDIKVLDVKEQTSIADYFIIASATSNRHMKACADNVEEACKEKGFRPLGTEGDKLSEWVLVDLGDVIVHIMLPSSREFYDLESLWSHTPATRQQAQGQQEFEVE